MAFENPYYYKVKGLMVPHNNVPQTLYKSIDGYIDTVEQYTADLESLWDKKDLHNFLEKLDHVQGMLRAVFAKWLEADCNMLMRNVRSKGLDENRDLLTQFISNLLTLSIDMQQAQNERDTGTQARSEMEIQNEIAHNLSAVGKLIHIAEYQKADAIVKAVSGEKSLGNLAKDLREVSEMLKTHNYEGAIALSEKIHRDYTVKTKRAGGPSDTLKTVFAVDDKPDVLNSISIALDGHYKVLGAPGGDMALKIIKKQKADLFILDIDMPGMNGFELAERIQKEEGYAQTPIIFLTATSSRERILKSMKLGIRDFIVKPAYDETLLAKVGKYLI